MVFVSNQQQKYSLENSLGRSKRGYMGKSILWIILALLIIQLLRATLMLSLWWWVKPGDNIILFQILNGLSMGLVGIGLLIYFKPTLKELSLNWDDMKTRSRWMYSLLGALLLFLTFSPFFLFSTEMGIMGVIFGLMVPAFEELLFRGYLWNNVQNKLDKCGIEKSGLWTLIIITALFSLWHMGYVDVFLIHPLQADLAMMILSKLMIGLVLGGIVGLIRLKTGKVYGSFLFHGFWNTFAP